MRASFPLPRLVATTGLAFFLALACSSPTPGQESPSAASSPARFIPKDNLLFYLEYQGLDAQTEAWNKTAAAKILDGTPTGAMLEDTVNQVVEKLLALGGKPVPAGGQVLTTLKKFAHNGFTFAIVGNPKNPMDPNEATFALVLRNAFKEKELRSFMAGFFSTYNAPNTKPQSIVRDGHKVISGVNATGKAFTWWVEDSKKEDIVFVMGKAETADVILEAVDGKRPNVLDLPRRVELFKTEGSFVPNGVVFFGPKAFEGGKLEEQLGFRNVTALELRWGFEDEALVTRTRIATSGPRKGIFALMDGSTFDKGKLPPIPDAATGFTVASFDLPATLERLTELAKGFKPDAEDAVKQVADALKDKTKLRLKEDLLAHLGPKVAWYSVPNKGATTARPAVPGLFGAMENPRFAAVFDVDDAAAFGKVLDQAIAAANREFKTMGRPPGEAPAKGARSRGPTPPTPDFRPLSGEGKGYFLNVPPELTAQFPAWFRPVIRVGPKHVVVAVSADIAKAVLETKGAWTPPTNLAASFGALPSNLKMLNVADPREVMPGLLASFPGKVQAIVNSAMMVRMAPPPGGPGGPPPPQPPPGGAPFVLKVDAAKLPSAEAIKALLFPSLLTVEATGDEIRIVSREAFPSIGDPSTIAIQTALILPAVQAARDAARRAQQAPGANPPASKPPGGAGGATDGFFDVPPRPPGSKPPGREGGATPPKAGTPAKKAVGSANNPN